MKRLKTNYNGGLPFSLDVFRYHEEGIYEALVNICRALMPEQEGRKGLVLRGCGMTFVSGITWQVQEGMVYLRNDTIEGIYYVPAHTVDNGPDSFRWEVSDEYDPAGAKVFFDGATHDIYKIQTARVVDSGDTNLIGYSEVFPVTSIWYQPLLFGTFENVSGAELKIRRGVDCVQIRGIISGITGSVCTMPEHYKPPHDLIFPVVRPDISLSCHLNIDTGGQVSITAPEGLSITEAGNYYININIPL